MPKLVVASIKNKNKFVELRIKNDKRLKNPFLWVKSRKNREHSIKVLPSKIEGHCLVFVFSVDSLSPLSLYYDLYIESNSQKGELLFERITSKSKIQRITINLFNLKKQTTTFNDEEYLVTEYFSSGAFLSIQVRETDHYDNFKYRFNEFCAVLLTPFVYWYYKDSKLIYEKLSNYARDNSFYYFSYVQKNVVNNKLFYIIREESPDLKNLKPYRKRVVYFMSIKHLILLISSKYFIASESKGHAYAWRHNQSVARYFLNRKPFVFLQHGVLGLKQVDHTFFASNRLNHADLFITSSQIEKQIVLNFLGYQDDNVAVTGLARWDNFKKLPKEKKIFVMPTWRVQLDLLSDQEFLASEFFEAYSSLLHSDKIKRILHENGYSLHFMLHPKFVRFEKYFMSDDENIKIFHQSELPIDMELKTSSLVITDYSSIMWDALYYSCPVLLFQFDQKDYLETQGSYLDFDSGLKDIIIKNPQDLLQQISMFMQQKETFDLSHLQHKYFAYHDKNNSKRIKNSISKWEESYDFIPFYKKLVLRLKK